MHPRKTSCGLREISKRKNARKETVYKSIPLFLCPLQEYQKPCSPEAQLVNLTDYTDVIVKMHNEPRQRLALGRNMTLPRAARLVMMQWSEELATLASYNARMCQAKYDDCRNTANFKNSGQNIIVSGKARNPSIFKSILACSLVSCFLLSYST